MTEAPDTVETTDTQAPASAPSHPPEASALVGEEAAPQAAPAPLLKTPLHALHVARGGRMVPFAGYEMPVQYPDGIIAEHNHVRTQTGLFDVSHMGQAFLVGADHETVARALETLVPADIIDLAPGRQRYTQLTNEEGGILDDLMVTRSADPAEDGLLFLVVNAATKEADYAHLAARLPRRRAADPRGASCARCGAGADGAAGRWAALPRGGADDVHERNHDALRRNRLPHQPLRLHRRRRFRDFLQGDARARHRRAAALRAEREADRARLARTGCAWKQASASTATTSIPTTSPIEAALTWSIQKRRRTEGGFPGAERIQREIAEQPARLRAGIKPDGRAPAREGTEIRSIAGEPIGKVTSGGFGPTVNGPIAMGYVENGFAEPGTNVQLIVRGKELAASIVALPFVPHRYVR